MEILFSIPWSCHHWWTVVNVSSVLFFFLMEKLLQRFFGYIDLLFPLRTVLLGYVFIFDQVVYKIDATIACFCVLEYLLRRFIIFYIACFLETLLKIVFVFVNWSSCTNPSFWWQRYSRTFLLVPMLWSEFVVDSDVTVGLCGHCKFSAYVMVRLLLYWKLCCQL